MHESPEWRTVTQTNFIQISDIPEQTQIKITDYLAIHINDLGCYRKRRNSTYEINVIRLNPVFTGTGFETSLPVETLATCTKTLASLDSAKTSAIKFAHNYAIERMQALKALLQTASNSFEENRDIWDESADGHTRRHSITADACLEIEEARYAAIDSLRMYEVRYEPERIRLQVYASDIQTAIENAKSKFLRHLDALKEQALDDCDAIHILRTANNNP